MLILKFQFRKAVNGYLTKHLNHENPKAMKAETFLLALVLIIFGVWLHVSLTYHEPPIPPCKDFHNCRIIQIDTDGDSAIYTALLTDTCRHGSLVHFKAEADRFNAGDTAQGNFFGQSK